MTRTQRFIDKWKVCAPAVLRSIAKVAAAGRSGDPDKIKRERARHRAFMDNLP